MLVKAVHRNRGEPATRNSIHQRVRQISIPMQADPGGAGFEQWAGKRAHRYRQQPLPRKTNNFISQQINEKSVENALPKTHPTPRAFPHVPVAGDQIKEGIVKQSRSGSCCSQYCQLVESSHSRLAWPDGSGRLLSLQNGIKDPEMGKHIQPVPYCFFPPATAATCCNQTRLHSIRKKRQNSGERYVRRKKRQCATSKEWLNNTGALEHCRAVVGAVREGIFLHQ